MTRKELDSFPLYSFVGMEDTAIDLEMYNTTLEKFPALISVGIVDAGESKEFVGDVEVAVKACVLNYMRSCEITDFIYDVIASPDARAKFAARHNGEDNSSAQSAIARRSTEKVTKVIFDFLDKLIEFSIPYFEDKLPYVYHGINAQNGCAVLRMMTFNEFCQHYNKKEAIE